MEMGTDLSHTIVFLLVERLNKDLLRGQSQLY